MRDFRGALYRRRLARELAEHAPQPREEPLAGIVARIERQARRRHARARLAAAAGLSAALAAALGSVGGIGYAATAVGQAAGTVKKIVTPKQRQQPITVLSLTAGGDQYRPGFGFGDPNHNHTGPPGLQRSGGPAAPPLRAIAAGSLGRNVGTQITLDEQAVLWISVVDRTGRPLLLTQRSKRGGSVVGEGITGPQVKFIKYVMLVPRTIPLRLRVPSNLLRRGQSYRIRIVAVDHQGNKTTTFVPFTG
jgi:hypothetical protein